MLLVLGVNMSSLLSKSCQIYSIVSKARILGKLQIYRRDSGALPRLFPFPWDSLFTGPILSLLEASIYHLHMSLKEKEYKVDDCTKKVALFFLVCDLSLDSQSQLP